MVYNVYVIQRTDTLEYLTWLPAPQQWNRHLLNACLIGGYEIAHAVATTMFTDIPLQLVQVSLTYNTGAIYNV